MTSLRERCAAAAFLKAVNGWLTLFFLIQIPFALLTSLKRSVPYLVFLSLWALVASHAAAWIAGRVEVNQEETP